MRSRSTFNVQHSTMLLTLTILVGQGEYFLFRDREAHYVEYLLTTPSSRNATPRVPKKTVRVGVVSPNSPNSPPGQ